MFRAMEPMGAAVLADETETSWNGEAAPLAAARLSETTSSNRRDPSVRHAISQCAYAHMRQVVRRRRILSSWGTIAEIKWQGLEEE
jgi:hypothetical protein